MPDPIPFYPALPCWQAPLREGSTPKPGCLCRVCLWARGERDKNDGPVRPDTPAWGALLTLAGVPA